MSSRRHSPFDHAVHSANAWLADVARALGTEDRHFAYRVVRAWLHTLRDRLTVDSAVQFGAQLPELLRGIYYDGWDPSRVPVKFGAEEYTFRFAELAHIPPEDVPQVASATSDALQQHLSPGQLESALAQLPTRMRSMIQPPPRPPGPAARSSQVQKERGPAASPDGRPSGEPNEEPLAHRVQRLEAQVSSVVEALRVLAHGLEAAPGAAPDERRASHAARQAYELLLAGRSAENST
jgi:uncharacterized protein (DUF2267 family)